MVGGHRTTAARMRPWGNSGTRTKVREGPTQTCRLYLAPPLFPSGLQVGGQAVTIRVTTSSMRAKRLSDGEVLFELPMFHVSYCGTDRRFKEAFT